MDHTSTYNFKYPFLVTYSTGWLVTGGRSGKGVILREKRSRKYRILIFRLRLCFRENRLWIFARYACTLSRLAMTDLTVDRCLDEYYRSLFVLCRNGKLGIHNEVIWSNHKVYYSVLLIKFLWTLSNVFNCFKVWKATIIFSVITRRDKVHAYRAKI